MMEKATRELMMLLNPTGELRIVILGLASGFILLQKTVVQCIAPSFIVRSLGQVVQVHC